MKHKKLLLMAQKIDRAFSNLNLKKKQLFISSSSGVINFLIKPCNPTFLRNSSLFDEFVCKLGLFWHA
jgi:hypothetical protein